MSLRVWLPNRGHLIEYAAEAWALGLFMVAACVFGVLLFHPASPIVPAVPDEPQRRALMGLAMGLTAIGNIYSPWGRRSGAHMNPATTLTFLGLGKVAPGDAVGYVLAQFAGALGGTLLASAALSGWLRDPAVNFVATLPGPWGVGPAFLAEVVISGGLMLVVLSLIARPKLAPLAGWAAGMMVALYTLVESPISGMSMNPARSLGTALPAMRSDGLWIYFLAPPLGMLAAAALHRGRLGYGRPHCAKYHHDPAYRCIFCAHHAARR